MITRRGFLQLLSAVGASIALPVPKFVLAAPEEIILEMPVRLGEIRALSMYVIHRDESIIRLDAYNGTKQFTVDFAVGGQPDMRKAYLESRKVAEELLFNAIKKEGWMASDLIALPTPLGYKEPRWMQP